ncbi:IbrB-like domain-containing protein [Methanosphaera cuniculi]|uniref:ParB-like nuclease domain protein n=1 Tax=Methanosphaera cuniculi TaxID=1077256 RepID=A0A2A2HE87_9EURY|nr:ParB/RepB/Spo0J family partition protein [Methanosphaera cuniculi]PAV07553.1 hypothetical protein ASJ82_07705 [Methanosphaera cuniculi]PWL08130.1 ParB-like nuclease domain protein [Methanosphaera cuniculi]
MIEDTIKQLKKELNDIDNIDEKVEKINMINKEIAECMPFDEPISHVQWIQGDQIEANEYNPNKVATPEMNLLYESIRVDGYTQPIVAYKKEDGYEIVDGFHRNRVGKEHEDIKERLHGYLPLTVIDKPLDERMGSTIRHNRARGTHQIRSMSDIVIELSSEGWSDDRICKSLGMEMDEVLRLKQISGLKKAFSNHKFSKSWTEFISKTYDE